VFFPEFLYQLSARDQRVTWLDPLITDLTTLASSLQIDVPVIVPEGRCLVLKNAVTEADPGAAQIVNVIALGLVTPSLSNFIELQINRTPFAADTTAIPSWQGEVVVPPLWQITARGVFNAVVAANRVRLDIVGILIPVGNIQRV